MKALVTTVVSFVLLLILTAVAVPASAQTEQEPPNDPSVTQQEPPPKVTEEMVVTARKREESVQEVPISVVAPTEADLRDAGADDIEDIAANVAGFTVQNLGPGQSQVAMRGVSAGQIVRDQPGVKEQVGVYLDESVISLSLFTPDVDLFDVSRVEVLRGPQGTLFGSGSLSGTLRYITNQPKLGHTETIGELSLSSIEDGGTGATAKAAVNVPIGANAAMRVVGYYTKYGGFLDAIQPDLSLNEDVNSGSRAGARIAFRFEPNDKFTITPRLLYQKIEMDGWNRIDAFNILANPYTTTRPKVTFEGRQQFTQIEEPYTDDFLLGDLNLSYELGGATLTSITSYTDRDVDVIRDATALTASITGGSIGLPPAAYLIDAPLDDVTTAKSLTQELRLSGERGPLQWLVGGFYSDTDRDYAQSLFVNGFETVTGIPTAGAFGAPRDVLYFSELTYAFKQFAIFGEATWSVSDRFDVTGGLRYYDFDEDRVQTFDGIFADPGSSAGSTQADGIAPRVMLSYKLNDATRLNGQISKGFRLGGINDPLNVPLCTPQDLETFGGQESWKDETLWNYEIGAKRTLRGGRGHFNIAAFRADISDLQATVTAGSCSSRVIFNVPKARSQGVEMEVEYAPSDFFDFAISATKLNAELRSTLTSTNSAGVTSVVAGIESGNRLPTVPEFQMAAAGSVHWTMGTIGGYVTGVYQHVGSRYTQIGDQAAGFGTVSLTSFAPNNIGGPFTQSTFTFDPKLPSYDLVNLRLGFLVKNFDTALYVNNVFDETALLALDQERGTRARVGYLTNEPRTIGVSTRFTF
ncbi:MAG TPA: TonB-dependent receptor [Thermoanaerobaculia bacterium]|nr:TonB-dependent receptor [Thermoanaerobaculia bacterium]